MKKFVAGVSAAIVLAAGGVAAEGAVVASHADTPGNYSVTLTKADLQKTVKNIKQQIREDNVSGIKAGKLIQKLRNYKKVGLLSQAKFKKLRQQLKAAI